MEKIILGHGSGGRLMHSLIKETILKKLSNPILKELGDGAFIDYKEKLAFTTDSFVVNPVFFPGGDIGKLSVFGTVNDLAMMGAKPEYLSLALIIEEGLEAKVLDKIIDSISQAAKSCGVQVATGDLKVVEKGSADKIFINTSGIGRIIAKKRLSIKKIKPGDKVILTGDIGRHGLAVLAKRNDLDPGLEIVSDCAPLNNMLTPLLAGESGIRFMRDPTRGGLATTLNEIAEASGLGVSIEEKSIPVSQKVRAAGELLGIDPLYVACEGRAVIIAEAKKAKYILSALARHPLGRSSSIVGEMVSGPKRKVVLKTIFGTERLVDMLVSDPLPRIC